LELNKAVGSMLVIGGGIIGLEMATVYAALGTKITVVEFMDQLIPGADPDLVKPLHKRINKHYEKIMLETKVTQVEAKKDALYVTFEGKQATEKPEKFDQILVAVGRRPNGHNIAADKAGVNVDGRGFIAVDKQMRTNIPHIYAIGDIVGQPMLAHKAIPEGLASGLYLTVRADLLEIERLASSLTLDPYVLQREAYLQRRAYLISLQSGGEDATGETDAETLYVSDDGDDDDDDDWANELFY